jgi:flavin-dependent dehydrogenase
MNKDNFADAFGSGATAPATPARDSMELGDGSRVAVLGGGPAGSFFSYFLLDIAQRVGVAPRVDIFEKRIFTKIGPIGCNMCGGIISESLVQTLAAEGITLPPTIVERGIDSYILHMDVGSTRIDTPLQEKRIAAVHRGAGPKGATEVKWGSFDGFLLDMAKSKGANHIQGQVDDISIVDGKPTLRVKGGEPASYDLLAVCVGVNSPTLKLFGELPIDYTPPKTSKTFISEFFLGEETVGKYLGSSMHVFLMNIPRVEFAALIPKGDYVTFCMLGEDIDDELVRRLLDTPQVKGCLPPGWEIPQVFCHCSPKINVKGADPPFSDRLVFIGDCGATRLYKDGIGAAYRTAKAAAATAALHGVAATDFRKHFMPVCRSIERDNLIGKFIFGFNHQIQKIKQDRRGVLGMVLHEQAKTSRPKRMSMVMWDTFTGSASYGDILLRTMHPAFLFGLIRHIVASFLKPNSFNGKGE